MHRLFSKDQMPTVLQNPPTNMIIQTGLQNPVPIPVVIGNLPFQDLLPSYRELSTTCYSDDFREVLAGEERFEGGGVGDLGRLCSFRVGGHLLRDVAGF